MAIVNNSEILLNSFLRTAENVITLYDENKNKRNEILKDLEEIVSTSCTYDQKTKKVLSVVEALDNNFDDNNDDLDKILELFNEQRDELLQYKPDVSEHPNLKEYCRQVKDIVDNADGVGRLQILDDDIEMTQDDTNVIDPFTKKRMTDPVKNKTCGHVYDRESVTSLIQINKNTRCPVVGCSNKNPVTMENLVSDIMTKKYLQNNPA